MDEDTGELISDAEVAETPYTGFTSRPAARHVAARLIVRRVRRLNPAATAGQGELFPGYRHHAVFTDSPLTLLQAEACHRGHAIVEQVIADLKGGPLAHLPSGSFTANAAWLVCAAIAFNLTRAAGCLASTFHAKATTATLRAQLITVPGRIARSARQLVLHLPTDWRWEHPWQSAQRRRPLTRRPCDHPRPRNRKWKRWADRRFQHDHTTHRRKPTSTTSTQNPGGGSRLSHAPHANRWTEEDHLENLRHVWEHHSRAPTAEQMGHPPSRISADSYKLRFGSWRQALGRVASEIPA